MTETLPLNDALIILAAAILFVPLFQRMKVSPVLGYLAAGLAIGPHGLGLIAEIGGARLLAEFGVIFLLFAIGLELPLARLMAMRRYILGLGLAQVAVTSLVIGLIALVFRQGAVAALVLGGALALSSTAAVLQHLVERGEVTARYGRAAIGVLLFQDLAVIPLLVLLPLLAGAGAEGGGGLVQVLGFAALKAAGVLAAIVLIGRFVIRPVYRLIAGTRNPELFAATSVFVALGTGWATEHAGMSMALGAFLAGLMLADSEYRHQIEADIQPFRGLFLGLFFMAVGMAVDLGRLADNPGIVLGLAAALLVGKAAILTGLGLLLRLELALSVRVGLLLAQCGEFAFVIGGFAVFQGVLDQDLAQIVFLVVAVTMAATPLLAVLGRRWSQSLERRTAHGAHHAEAGEPLDGHVVIAGFGRVGRTVAELLTAQGVPYVALDQDPARVADCRADGLPVFYGDASRAEVMSAVGGGRARVVAVTLDKPGPAERAVEALRHGNPRIPVVARGRDMADLSRLEEAGATEVVPEALEGSLRLGATVLRLAGANDDDIQETLNRFREDDYARLKPFQTTSTESEPES